MPGGELPDFIIGGPPRSGTSWLFYNMAQHPRICTSSLKEPWFFITPEDLKRYRSVPLPRPRRWRWYENLFSHCAADAIRGEGSTAYFYARGSADLIRSAAPSVRLLFVLRDPVDRVYSHYLHDLRSRRLPSLDEMIERGHPRLEHYVDVSGYAGHLERFYRVFPPKQILVLFLEDMRARPGPVIESAFSFVGADPSFVPAELEVARNPSARTRSRIAARVFSPRPLPLPGLHKPWERVSAAVRRVNRVRISSAPRPEWRRELLPRFTEDVEALERLVGRSLDPWKRADQPASS